MSKPKPKKLSVPRELTAIQKDAAEAYMKLGQLEYTIQVYQEDIKRLTEDLKKFNNEAHYRNQLDAQKNASPKVDLPKPEEVTNAPN